MTHRGTTRNFWLGVQKYHILHHSSNAKPQKPGRVPLHENFVSKFQICQKCRGHWSWLGVWTPAPRGQWRPWTV